MRLFSITKLLQRIEAEAQQAVEIGWFDTTGDHRNIGRAGVEHDGGHVHLYAASPRATVAVKAVRNGIDRAFHGQNTASTGIPGILILPQLKS